MRLLVERATQFDHRWFYALERIRQHRPRVCHVFKWVSKTGDGYAVLALFVYLCAAAQWAALGATALAITGERLVYFVVKNKTKRHRPPQKFPNFKSIIQASDQFSFPSGHTSAACFVALVAASYFPLFALPLACWAVAVAASRVVLGVHFPTDLLAGAVLGCTFASLVLWLV